MLVVVVGGLAACDTYEQDEYAPEYVVESYLVAGEPLPPLKLSTTAPVDELYTFEAFAVEGATVVVNLLDASGAVEESYAYRPTARGIYEPEDTTDVVLPLRRYALEIQVPDGVVRSSTLVPGPFDLLEASTDTLVYQSPEQLEATVTRSEYPGRQTIYVFTLEALDTNYGLTPLYADFVEDDDDLSPEDFVRNSSGLSNESNFDQNPDGTLTLRMPWVAVAFYGPNRIIAYAVDDNVYDFKRSQAGSGTTSPGEMDNLIDHVEGGRGIFGSMAADEIEVFIRPPAGM